MSWITLAWMVFVAGFILVAVVVPAWRHDWAEGREQQPQVRAWSTPRRKP